MYIYIYLCVCINIFVYVSKLSNSWGDKIDQTWSNMGLNKINILYKYIPLSGELYILLVKHAAYLQMLGPHTQLQQELPFHCGIARWFYPKTEELDMIYAS
jgi:hypothetical protein